MTQQPRCPAPARPRVVDTPKEKKMEQEDARQQGTVFNIQKYSVHDGPGIRTIVFFKGCSLACRWCSNPESQSGAPELAYNAGRCLSLVKCGHCLPACPHGSIAEGSDGKPFIDRSHCTGCSLPCVQACPAQGLLAYGQTRSVDEVLRVVEQDMAFYSRSGGGLTLSGGEPLLQDSFALALLREARKRRIKTAVETCGMVAPDVVREAASFLNHVLFDLKHMDAVVHKAQTGCSNARILDNFRILADDFPEVPVLARTPVIPGFNDTPEAIAAIADFVKPFGRIRYELLPYHRLGTQKYHFLGREAPLGDAQLDKDLFRALQGVAQNILGERVQIPG